MDAHCGSSAEREVTGGSKVFVRGIPGCVGRCGCIQWVMACNWYSTSNADRSYAYVNLVTSL